jgi:hypothetical protein
VVVPHRLKSSIARVFVGILNTGPESAIGSRNLGRISSEPNCGDRVRMYGMYESESAIRTIGLDRVLVCIPLFIHIEDICPSG